MPKTIVYIATSLDGYIARTDDDVSWLDAYQVAGEDYGFSDFMTTIGTAIMGARTYDQTLRHPERMLAGVRTYVLSEKPLPLLAGADVEFFSGDLGMLIERIKQESTKDIYIVGGGRLISSLLNARLIDEVLQFIAPVLLKEGIPLYSALDKEISLHLVDARPYHTGIVKLHYVLGGRPRPARV